MMSDDRKIQDEIMRLTESLSGSRAFYAVMVEAMMMHSKKAQDYTGASSDPFANFRASARWAGTSPLQAIQMHQGNKIDRIRNLQTRPVANYESELDSKFDLMVYLGLELAWRRTNG
jgi:hypothetical protein